MEIENGLSGYVTLECGRLQRRMIVDPGYYHYVTTFQQLDVVVIQQLSRHDNGSGQTAIYDLAQTMNSRYVGKVYKQLYDKNHRSALIVQFYNTKLDTYINNYWNPFGGYWKNPNICPKFREIINDYCQGICYLHNNNIRHHPLTSRNFAIIDDEPAGILVEIKPGNIHLQMSLQMDLGGLIDGIAHCAPRWRHLIYGAAKRLHMILTHLREESPNLLRSMERINTHPIFLSANSRLDLVVTAANHRYQLADTTDFDTHLENATAWFATAPADWVALASGRFQHTLSIGTYGLTPMEFLRFVRNVKCHHLQIHPYTFAGIDGLYEAIEDIWPHFIDAVHFALSLTS